MSFDVLLYKECFNDKRLETLFIYSQTVQLLNQYPHTAIHISAEEVRLTLSVNKINYTKLVY